ncbi:MAG TPA: hypothetical protein VGQ55_13700, partial [Pyrinomonadaceae bacterium]|nr:hypothetical protein [Pyrinomonadaceae bacterium]
ISRLVDKTLADERAHLIDKSKVPFEKKILTPHLANDVQIIQNSREARDLAVFRDSYFAATSGGLLQISDDGKPVRHFTVLDGLPESDLTCLAVYNDKLFIGTKTKGLVTFNGENFAKYTWPDRRQQAITLLLAADGELLIGTFNGGLLQFDGAKFIEINAENERIAAVDCLLKDGPRLFVGTFNNGLHIYQNDTWTHFTTAEGLPSNRVVGLAKNDGKLFAATDFGAAVLEDQRFRSVATLPSISAMSQRGNQVLVTKDDGEIYSFDAPLKKISENGGMQNARLVSIGDKMWLLSDLGIFEVDGARIRPFAVGSENELKDNFVSAVAISGGDLWVGTFQSGIDVLSSGSRRIRHLETDDLREINFLEADGLKMRAATSSGIAEIGANLSISNRLTKKDGLPSNSVTHFSGDTIATAKGLVFRADGKFHVLSTVQGMPSNGVYTTLKADGKLYAGTLGGLVVIENGHVSRVFKDSNSNLNTNWVTALCIGAGRIFIGTYGGGVFELLPSGEVRAFEAETGKFVVNVNAMHS